MMENSFYEFIHWELSMKRDGQANQCFRQQINCEFRLGVFWERFNHWLDYLSRKTTLLIEKALDELKLQILINEMGFKQFRVFEWLEL